MEQLSQANLFSSKKEYCKAAHHEIAFTCYAHFIHSNEIKRVRQYGLITEEVKNNITNFIISTENDITKSVKYDYHITSII